MVLIARNVNNKKYVAWIYADFLDVKEVLSIIKIIGVAMYLVHSNTFIKINDGHVFI